MRQETTILKVATSGRGFFEITGELRAWVAGLRVTGALLALPCRHTSASLTVQENAAPAVRARHAELAGPNCARGRRLAAHLIGA